MASMLSHFFFFLRSDMFKSLKKKKKIVHSKKKKNQIITRTGVINFDIHHCDLHCTDLQRNYVYN
jgi:hypothetical protein